MAKSESSKEAKQPKIHSQKALAIVLSRLEVFTDPKVSLEQYPTDSEIAAQVLWTAHMNGDIPKVSADLGAGTGILGLGLLCLGAQTVHFVESDPAAIEIAQKNHEKLKSEGYIQGKAVFHNSPISEFSVKCGLIVQNPPFGTKVRHADREFLEKSMSLAPTIFSFHTSESKSFVENTAKANTYAVSGVLDVDFPLKATYKFHSKRIQRIPVSVFRLVRE